MTTQTAAIFVLGFLTGTAFGAGYMLIAWCRDIRRIRSLAKLDAKLSDS